MSCAESLMLVVVVIVVIIYIFQSQAVFSKLNLINKLRDDCGERPLANNIIVSGPNWWKYKK